MGKLKLGWLKPTAFWLVIAGAINWILAMWNYNLAKLVATAANMPGLESFIYWAIGISAIYLIFVSTKKKRR